MEAWQNLKQLQRDVEKEINIHLKIDENDYSKISSDSARDMIVKNIDILQKLDWYEKRISEGNNGENADS